MAEIRKISTFNSGDRIIQGLNKSFNPSTIHYDWLVDVPGLCVLLSDADRWLGSLNAYADMVPDVNFFIQMHINKEANTSSKIEGTQTSMNDVLMKEADVTPEKKDDWVEVQNYIRAINQSIDQVKTRPITSELVRETHKVLMHGVRGHGKSPGEFRKKQNWIGATERDATYIPPQHELVEKLMNDFELFLNDETIHTPHLIRIGMLHYQFETIHPFLDGNGRMGRLLIT
ncbi:MAG: Fic family protein, partial [Flavobacterium sp.]|uniref:Fic family protein n=1 Tax=Flavobacterium sp. TaxID=239 RepID=UPI0039198B17